MPASRSQVCLSGLWQIVQRVEKGKLSLGSRVRLNIRSSLDFKKGKEFQRLNLYLPRASSALLRRNLPNCENLSASQFRLHIITRYMHMIISSSPLLELRPKRSSYEIPSITVLKMPVTCIKVETPLAAFVATALL